MHRFVFAFPPSRDVLSLTLLGFLDNEAPQLPQQNVPEIEQVFQYAHARITQGHV